MSQERIDFSFLLPKDSEQGQGDKKGNKNGGKGKRTQEEFEIPLHLVENRGAMTSVDLEQRMADAYFREIDNPRGHLGSIEIQDLALQYVLMRVIEQKYFPSDISSMLNWVGGIFTSRTEALSKTSKYFKDTQSYWRWKQIPGKKPPELKGVEPPYWFIVNEGGGFLQSFSSPNAANSRTCEIGSSPELDSKRKIDLVKIEKGAGGKYRVFLVQCKYSAPSTSEERAILESHREFVASLIEKSKKEAKSLEHDDLGVDAQTKLLGSFLDEVILNAEEDTPLMLQMPKSLTLEKVFHDWFNSDNVSEGDRENFRKAFSFADDDVLETLKKFVQSYIRETEYSEESPIADSVAEFLKDFRGKNRPKKSAAAREKVFLHRGNADFVSVVYYRHKNVWGMYKNGDPGYTEI